MNRSLRVYRMLAVMLLAISLAGLSGCAHSAPPVTATDAEPYFPPSTPVLLEAGDELEISFIGAPELNGTQTIRRDGRLSLPILGDIVAKGMTVENFRRVLTQLYQPHLQTREITVVVRSQPPIFVSGAVQTPGRIEMRRYMTALEAVMEADGFDLDVADMQRVVVIRQTESGRQEFRLDLGAILEGRGGPSFYLMPHDIIHVPRRSPWF